MTPRVLNLRYASSCSSCGASLAAGARAAWDRQKRLATCEACLVRDGTLPVDRGSAGASAAREWQRRRDRREREIRERHPRIGGVILALTDDPQSTQSWAKGAAGERALGESLDRLAQEGMSVLHDRRIPGSRANIDHLVVSAAGVFVVDPKKYAGKVERRDVGGWFRTDERLYVGRRDRTKLVVGARRQQDVVRRVLADAGEHHVPVSAALCFLDAEWGIFPSPFRLDGVHVVWPGALGKVLRAAGPLKPDDVARIERGLAVALPCA